MKHHVPVGRLDGVGQLVAVHMQNRVKQNLFVNDYGARLSLSH
jgi:hypothetical protein